MKQLRNLMVSHVEVVRPNTSLREAARRMKRLEIGALPVCEGDRVQGIITDRDIVMRTVAEGINPEQAKASDIMTRNVVFCYEDQSVEEAAEIMRDKRIGRLLVLNRDRRLRGILTLGNLNRYLGQSHFSDLVLERLQESEGIAPMSRFGLGPVLGTVAGLASIIAGVFYLRNQPREGELSRLRKVA